MRTDRKHSYKPDKKGLSRSHKQGVVGYSKKSALLEEAITHMNTGKYGRSSAALKELLSLDPQNMEARRLFATLHLRLGSLVTAREAFEALANEAIGRQDYWLAESLLREYLAAGPRCIPFLELLAHVYSEKGDEMAAVAELGKAVEILLEDPDPENPQKPALIYSKIRQLAPASPVAFQFASLFDVQTGEFRLSKTPGQSEQGLHVESHIEAPPAAAITGEKSDPPMPWEQLDDLHVTQATLSQVDLTIQETHSYPTAPISVYTDIEQLPSSIEPSDMTSSGEQTSVADTPAPLTAAGEDGQVLEHPSPGPSLEETVASPDRNSDTAVVIPASVASTKSACMPWEQVADGDLKIVEANQLVELTNEESIVADALPLPQSEPSTPAPSFGTDLLEERKQEQVVQDAPVQIPASSVETPAADPAVSTAADSASAETAPSQSTTSFSWNAIFDTAWQFAVGTPASDSAETIKAQSETVTHGLEKAFEPPSPTSIAPEPSVYESSIQSSAVEPALSVTPDDAIPASSIMAEGASLDHSTPEAMMLSGLSVEEATPEAQPVPDSSLPDSFTLVEERQVIPQPTTIDPLPPIPEENVTEPVASVVAQSTVVETPKTLEAPPVDAAHAVVPQPIEEPLKPAESQTLSAWNTGEVAIQSHRPAKAKKKWERDHIDEVPTPAPAAPSVFDGPREPALESEQTWEPMANESAVIDEAPPKPVDARPDWMQASDTIVLGAGSARVREDRTIPSSEFEGRPSLATAASAVDVLFGPTAHMGQETYPHTLDRDAAPKRRPWLLTRLARIRIAISSFLWSCISTGRAFTLLCLSLVGSAAAISALAVGGIGIAWVVMEEPPTARYQNLLTSPQRTVTDPKKNGYLLLLGFDAPAGRDPIETGDGRKAGESDLANAKICMMIGQTISAPPTAPASAQLVQGWFKGADPLAPIKSNGATIKSMAGQESLALERYQRWISMSFDDWGFGQVISPNCAHILYTHRLYLLEGFSQDPATGLSRLEKDMDSWRATLGQSKTLMVKMLAATAIQDDVTVASSLLTRSDTDAAMLERLSRVVRPLDQLELSVRWPMQSHFVWATQAAVKDIKMHSHEDAPLSVSLAGTLPMPVQRRANGYAEYYDAANKAVAEGRFTNLPQASSFMRTEPAGIVDYLANPIEHILGVEPLALWDPYVGQMVETDAQLRLASLQGMVRRGSQEKDVLARLAKAGQAYYDPFTGLPMLINQQKRLLYSVGRDGKDQDGDRQRDVVVSIPIAPSIGSSK